MDQAFVRSIRLLASEEGEQRVGYPWNLPAISALVDDVALHPGVTYLIGENGSGKSTLLEAIAVAAGINAEGRLVELCVLNPGFALRAVARDSLGARRAPSTDGFHSSR